MHPGEIKPIAKKKKSRRTSNIKRENFIEVFQIKCKNMKRERKAQPQL